MTLDAIQWVAPVQVYDPLTQMYVSPMQHIHSDVGPDDSDKSRRRQDNYGPRSLLALAIDTDGDALGTKFFNQRPNGEFDEVETAATTSSVGAFDTFVYHAGPPSTASVTDAGYNAQNPPPFRVAPIKKMFLLFSTPGFDDIRLAKLRQTQGIDTVYNVDLLGARVNYQ